MATFKAIAQQAPRWVNFSANIAGAATSNFIYINPPNSGEVFEVVEVSAIWDVASSSGTVDVQIVSNGTAVGGGTTVLSSTISNAGTARTPVTRALHTTNSHFIQAGQSLSVVFGGTQTNLTGFILNALLKPVRVRQSH